MMLILETPEEEKAFRVQTVTPIELNRILLMNNLDSEIRVAVNTSMLG